MCFQPFPTDSGAFFKNTTIMPLSHTQNNSLLTPWYPVHIQVSLIHNCLFIAGLWSPDPNRAPVSCLVLVSQYKFPPSVFHTLPDGEAGSLSVRISHTVAPDDGFLRMPITLILQPLNTRSGRPVPQAPSTGRSLSTCGGRLLHGLSKSASHLQGGPG